MAVYFQLMAKEEPEVPVSFISVDERLCAFLGVPCDAKRYHEEWYSIIGLSLACGHSWTEIREDLTRTGSKRLLSVLDFLEANYLSASWRGL